MDVKVKKTGTPLDNNETLPRMTILPSDFSWEISFDCRGFYYRGLSEPNLATAPEAVSTIEKATHGFSIVKAADGQRAVQFIKTRDDGTTVTFQLCEGARGVSHEDLAQYGNEKLKGATLKTHSEFWEIVDDLFKAVNGLKVANGELQTGDEALKLAFKIVQEGVRTEDGGIRVVFLPEDKDGGWVVSGYSVDASEGHWSVHDVVTRCAFFGVSSPELKKLDS